MKNPEALASFAREEVYAQHQLFANCAEAFQVPNKYFHNWQEHVTESYLVGMQLSEEYLANTPEEDREEFNLLAVGIALLGHDLGHGHPLDKARFDSKEHYAAYITGEICRTMDYPEEFIELTSALIMTTKAGSPCQTIMERIMRRADLYNVGLSWQRFFSDFQKVYKEESSEKPLPQAMMASAEFLLQFFDGVDLSLGAWDKGQDGLCPWVSRGLRNIRDLHEHGKQLLSRG